MLRDRLCQLVEDEKKEGQMLAQFRWKINIISLDEDHHHNNPNYTLITSTTTRTGRKRCVSCLTSTFGWQPCINNIGDHDGEHVMIN